MIIGIISDTHDNALNLMKAVRIFNRRKVDLVVHCGDWVSPFMPDFCKGLKCRIISIFGNNEAYKYGFLVKQKAKKWNIEFNNVTAEFNVGEKKAIVYHGDSPPLVKALVDSQNYDLVLTGDTHVPLIEKKGKTLHINPGTTCGQANSKIIGKNTVAIYDSKPHSAEIIKFS